MDTSINDILIEISRTYKQVYGDRIKRILLYGSYARGDYNADSDIDIAAIVDGDRTSLQKMLEDVWDVSSDMELEYGIIISPTVIPADEFEQYKEILPYYRNIVMEGREIA